MIYRGKGLATKQESDELELRMRLCSPGDKGQPWQCPLSIVSRSLV
jgi:hypothetical protein